mgnify:CR=1 FL=1
MFKPFIPARSKLKNFAPKILLCAQLIVLSIRNANIVSDGKASELGILNFEFLLMQAAKPSGELFSASPSKCAKRTIQKLKTQNSKFLIRSASAVRHANIVQRVKTCYKIKIDSRDLDCCFYGVLLCKQHPSLTIAPLLHTNSATIRV